MAFLATLILVSGAINSAPNGLTPKQKIDQALETKTHLDLEHTS